MARRTALSAELDPRVRQLVLQLRRLKEHTGLSTRQLAAKTEYSQKSWERYLVGRSLPPPEAVEALVRIAGADPVRMLALHEVADEAWDGVRVKEPTRQGPAPQGPVVEAGPAHATGRSLRIALVACSVALVLAVASTVLLLARLDDGHGEPATAAIPPAASAAGVASSHAPAYRCSLRQTDGRWYAGISRTQDAEIAYGSAGPDVAEAQCLLRRAGISPGGIDGMFGPLTQRAVKALQQRAGLDVDGMVGPHTWKALRG
ncbi:peptidoglycan-binding protein [Streptomyces sp. NPDC002588]|uniref:peptidoglycan-binding protein n=1 Tax=Streptomyces sp. NPDC002588 TaxID=3154419 RepID=UPI0033222CA5